jgi:16S rRNA (guanine966-N2)-methyltransferase
VRIIGGSHRGRTLAGLGGGDSAAQLRPTTDRVRESLFNLLAHGGYGDPPPPRDAHVLDVFAGTGALGLEALSRGAASAVFVEKGAKALALLRENVARLGAGDRASIIARDALRPGDHAGTPCDLVFLDPPYGRGLGERALAAAIAGGWIAPDALVAWEESTAIAPPPGLTLLDQRRYGDTMIFLLRHGVR